MRTLEFNTWIVGVVAIIVGVGSVGVKPVLANPTCILNCAQCVQLYGEYFDGHSCAQVCIEAKTRFESYIDCADPTNIARFIKAYPKNAPDF